jgi:hypothetical protein
VQRRLFRAERRVQASRARVPTEGAQIGVPVGIEFLGPPQLLQIIYGFEQTTHARTQTTAIYAAAKWPLD